MSSYQYIYPTYSSGSSSGMLQKLDGIADGSSTTIMIGEGYAGCKSTASTSSAAYPHYWYSTSYANFTKSNQVEIPVGDVCLSGNNLQTRPAGGALVSLADGSVRSVDASITLTTWQSAVDPIDGQPLGSDW
jgi:hypothetical protein